MKAKILFLFVVVALISLSFTFSGNTPSTPDVNPAQSTTSVNGSGEIAGFISDQVVK